MANATIYNNIAGLESRVYLIKILRYLTLFPRQCLELDVFVIPSTQSDELLMRSWLTYLPVFYEMTNNKGWDGEFDQCYGVATYMQSAFCIVAKECAMAMVVLPLAAWSRACWTTFSDAESSAEVAYYRVQPRHKERIGEANKLRRGGALSGFEVVHVRLQHVLVLYINNPVVW